MITDCGIYTITSPSGKQYVGSAVSFRKRWNLHRRELRKGVHHCIALQRAYTKYGEALVFRKIFLCRREDLLKWEQHFIDTLKPEYNICQVAGHPMEGRKHTDEAKKKNSEHSKKVWADPEIRKRISDANKASWTDERRKKHAAQRLGKAPHRPGWKHTEEDKKKMSESRGRKVLCVETGQVFRSATEAGRSLGRADGSYIIQVCKGVRVSSGGFHWKYMT